MKIGKKGTKIRKKMKKLKECNEKSQNREIINNYLLFRENVGEISRKIKINCMWRMKISIFLQ